MRSFFLLPLLLLSACADCPEPGAPVDVDRQTDEPDAPVGCDTIVVDIFGDVQPYTEDEGSIAGPFDVVRHPEGHETTPPGPCNIVVTTNADPLVRGYTWRSRVDDDMPSAVTVSMRRTAFVQPVLDAVVADIY